VTGVYPLIADGTPNTLVFAKRTGAAGTLVSTNGGPVQVSSAAYGLSGTGIWYLGTIGGGIDLGNFLGTAIRRVEIREGTFSDAQLQSISAGN
jgi:hypothetical protein